MVTSFSPSESPYHFGLHCFLHMLVYDEWNILLLKTEGDDFSHQAVRFAKDVFSSPKSFYLLIFR
ncbi:hypothetical protein EXW31_11805 [Bacillus mycoides]|uniref:Uncharacterized protein n=1 Tax=Bacillus cereus TaxID=1396 RepID=A0A1S9S856_BACCE|nr:hypothetical protein BW898_16975 [Bacillus cereus]OOR21885.1 hypothetical protein BW892_21540 [Bacillus cereus]QWG44935.1 hypothetical protein EXW31_11805 [Bacillus mycoides]